MKKFLSLFTTLFVAIGMMATTTVYKTVEELATANSWENGVVVTPFALDEVITVSTDATDANTGKYYTSGQQVRLYQTGGAKLIISAAEGYTISSITLTYVSYNTGILQEAESDVPVDFANVQSATFTVGNSGDASNGQARITAIAVTYDADIEDGWVVTGSNANLFGGAWDLAVAPVMTLIDGVYVFEKENVTLPKGDLEIKVDWNRSWDNANYPEQNYILYIAEDGIYDVRVTFHSITKEVNATAQKKGDAVIDHTAAIRGLFDDWANSIFLTLSEDKRVAKGTISLEEGDHTFKVILDESLWRSNEGTFDRDNSEASGISSNQNNNMILAADVAGDYEFIWTYEEDGLRIVFPEKSETPAELLAKLIDDATLIKNFIEQFDADAAMDMGQYIYQAQLVLEYGDEQSIQETIGVAQQLLDEAINNALSIGKDALIEQLNGLALATDEENCPVCQQIISDAVAYVQTVDWDYAQTVSVNLQELIASADKVLNDVVAELEQARSGEVPSSVVVFTADDFNGQGTPSTGSEVNATKDGVSFTCDKGYGDQYGVRCYSGSTVTIASAGQPISKIVFEFNTVNERYYNGGLDEEIEVNATEWTVTLSSQARMNTISVYLGEDESSVAYYLVGTMNGWTATEGYQFEANPYTSGEFMLNVILAEGDEFKVARVVDNQNVEWFPGGENNNYYVQENYAGEKTVYFNPNGNEDWMSFHEGGYFYMEKNPEDIYITANSDVRFLDNTATQGWWEMIYEGENYNLVISNTYSTQAPGTYTDEEIVRYSSISYNEGSSIQFASGSVTLSIDEYSGNVLLFGTLTGKDGNYYHIYMEYVVPTVQDEVTLTVPEAAFDDSYWVSEGLFQVLGMADETTGVSLGFFSTSKPGIYTEENLYANWSYMYLDGAEVFIYDADITVVENEDGSYTVTADLLCDDNTLYHVTMTVPAPEDIYVNISSGLEFYDWTADDNAWQIYKDDAISLVVSSSQIAGTYTVSDMYSDYSAVYNETTGDWILFTDGSIEVVEIEGSILVSGILTGSDGNYYHIELEYTAPVTDTYYLVGTMNGWTATEGYLFRANPYNDGEFMLNVTLEEGDEFKVARVVDNQNVEWFPGGENNNYYVQENYAGEKTVYFNPNGNDEWMSFHEGGYFYMEENFVPQDIDIIITSGTSYVDYCASAGWWNIWYDGEEYSIGLSNYSSTQAPGTYTDDEIDLEYSSISYKDGSSIHFVSGTLTLALVENGNVIVSGTLTGDDGNYYHIYMEYVVPTVQDEVTLTVPEAAFDDSYWGSEGLFQVWGMADETTGISLGIWSSTKPGIYTKDDLYASWSYMYLDGAVVFIYDADITVVENEDGSYTVTADLLCDDNTLYHVTMTVPAPAPPVAETEVTITIPDAAFDDTYWASDGLFGVWGWTNDETIAVELGIWSSTRTGSYTEDDLFANWSSVYIDNEEVQVYNAEITIVENADGSYTVTADLLCYDNTLYHVTMTVPAPVETAIGNVEAQTKTLKRLENGMVVIYKNGVKYTINGQMIR